MITAAQIQSVVSVNLQPFEKGMERVGTLAEKTASKLGTTFENSEARVIASYQRMTAAATEHTAAVIAGIHQRASASASARSQAQQQVNADKAEENALKAVNKQIELMDAKLKVLNGTDSLAVMRVQFNNLVPDSTLAKLDALTQKEQTFRMASKATAASILEQNNAQLKAAASADRAAEQAIAREKQLQAELAKRTTGAMLSGKSAAMNVAGSVGNGLLNMAAGVTGTGIGLARMESDISSSLLKVRNNTLMTDGEFARMRATVLKLGADSGAAFDDLANGYLHVANFAFKGADATKVLAAATRSAIATGTEAATTADILAGTMHNYGASADSAAKYMNVLHIAAAQGNMTLAEFNQAAGPAIATAAEYGVSLNEVASAISAMTRHQIPANQAATQFQGIIKAIVSPSKQAQDAINALAKISGNEGLARDFSVSGLKAKGLTGIIDDLNRATNNHAEVIISKLVPAQRGGRGMLELLSKGNQDYKEILNSTADAMAGRIDPTTKGYNDTLNTANNRVARLLNTMKVEFLPVGERFAKLFLDMSPAIKGVADMTLAALSGFTQLPVPMQEIVVGLGGMKIATLALGNPLSGLVPLLGNVTKMWKGVQAASLAAGAAESASLLPLLANPVILGIAATAAAVVGLSLLYNKLSETTAKTNEELLANARAHLASATSARDNASQVKTLSDKYDELRKIAHPTNDQLKRMQDILNKISIMNPELVTGYDRQGNALQLIADHANNAADALQRMNRAQTLAAASVPATENAAIVDRRATLIDELKKQQWLQSHNQTLTGGAGRWTQNSAEVSSPFASDVHHNAFTGQDKAWIPGMASSDAAQSAATAARIRDLQSQVNDLTRQSTALTASVRTTLQTTAGARVRQYSDPHFAAMNADFARRLSTMFADAADKGIHLGINSGFRSHELQAKLFAASDGSGRMVARPGHSNHEQGLAADLAFPNDAAKNWVHANAASYGLNFPMSYENWHIEPQGIRGGGNSNGGSSSGRAGNGMSADDLQSRFQAAMPHKLTPEEKEYQKFLTISAELQAKINEAQADGSTKAQALAARIIGLTSAHKAHVLALNATLEKTTEAKDAEKWYREELDKTNQHIRDMRKGDTTPLQKDMAARPTISLERMKHLENQRAADKIVTDQQDDVEKLTDKIKQLHVELSTGTEATDRNKSAWDALGHSYSAMNERGKSLLTTFMSLTLQVDAQKAAAKVMEDLAKRVTDAKARIELLTMSKDVQNTIKELGGGAVGLQAWKQLPKGTQENLVTSTKSGMTYESDLKTREDAERAFAGFHAEMSERIAAANDSIVGEDAQANWQRYLLGHKELALLLAMDGEKATEFAYIYKGMFETEQIQKATAALQSYNERMKESIEHSRLILSGQGDTIQAKWTDHLKQNPDMVQRFKQDPSLEKPAFDLFAQNEALNKQVAGYERMNVLMGDMQRKAAELTTADPFKVWLLSIASVDKVTGQLKLPEGMDMAKLKDLYKSNQMLDMFKEVTDGIQGIFGTMFDSIANKGFKGLFEGVYGGFKSLLVRMASEYLQSQLMQAMKSAFGGMFGMAGKPGADNPTGVAGASTNSSGGWGGLFSGGFGGLSGSTSGGGFGGFGGTPGIAGAAGGLFSSGFSAALRGLGGGGNGWDIPLFASGGRPEAGKPYVAGERGPELLLSDGNTNVLNNRDTQKYLSQNNSGGDTHHHYHTVNMTVNTPDAQGFRRSKGVILAELQTEMDRQTRRLK